MGKIKANEIEKHDASQITINSDTHVKAGQTLSVDTIAEKTSGSGVTVDGLTIKDTGFDEPVKMKGYTTSQINSLSGMGAGDTVYDTDMGTLKVYNGTSWNAMSDNTFQFNVAFLVIAGGGAGGGGRTVYGAGGGGGAGGYRVSYASDTSGQNSSTESMLSVTPSISYTVTVGAGGASVSGHTDGNAGSNSVFSSITSLGGGYGSKYGAAGGDGGSGGGAGWSNSSPGSGTSAQGFGGGNGNSASGSGRAAGGGGGAGGAGGNASTNDAGDGGAGLASTITGSSTTRASGGGGGGYSGNAPAGGGGSGSEDNNSGTAGTVNTGGGGGGVHNNASATSGAGGSGIVILRYSNAYTISNSGGGLTFTTATSGSDKITTFTAGTGTITFS